MCCQGLVTPDIAPPDAKNIKVPVSEYSFDAMADVAQRGCSKLDFHSHTEQALGVQTQMHDMITGVKAKVNPIFGMAAATMGNGVFDTCAIVRPTCVSTPMDTFGGSEEEAHHNSHDAV